MDITAALFLLVTSTLLSGVAYELVRTLRHGRRTGRPHEATQARPLWASDRDWADGTTLHLPSHPYSR